MGHFLKTQPKLPNQKVFDTTRPTEASAQT